MKKNVAGQTVGAQLISKTDGSAVTTGTTEVYVTGDAGTQTASGGSPSGAVHEGNGYWSFMPTQAETNFDHVAFTFVNSSAINVTVQVYTSFPQTGDNFARLGAPVGASISADIAGVQSDTDNIQTRLPAALVSGRMDASVGAMAAGVVTAAAIATDAIDADALAADAVAEIQSGLSTLDAAGVRSAVGLASANLDAQLAGIDSSTDILFGMTETGTGSPTYYRFKAEALEQAPTGSAPSAATIADAVWDEARAGHVAAGSFGEGIASVQGNVTGSVASVATGGISAGSFAAGAIDAAAIATDAIDADALKADAVTEIQSGLSTLTQANVRTAIGLATANLDTQLDALPTAAENADKLLGRNLATGSDGGRTVQDALRSLRNKSEIVTGTLTVYQEDDSTSAWTAAVTTAAGDPLSSIDPA